MKKANAIFNAVYDNIVTALFICDIICVILQVFARFVLRIAIPFTEELARFLLVGFGTLGMAVCARRGDHLGAYFLRDKSKKLQPVLFLFNSLVVLCVSLIFAVGAVQMIGLSGSKPASTMPWFLFWYLYAAFLTGIVLTALYAVRDLVNIILILLGKRQIESGLSAPTKED